MPQKTWLVAVDMGYGHQRALFPLRDLSPTGKLLIANNYDGISAAEKNLWDEGRAIYERISRLNNVPLIGPTLFGLFDRFQAVPTSPPRGINDHPTLQVRQNYYLIKRGWGRELITILNTKSIPLITSFFTVAFMAEEHGFNGEIFLLICDTDISRAWAPLVPAKSRIKYLASTEQAAARLASYGVPKHNIFLTGFPLPTENSEKISGVQKIYEARLKRLKLFEKQGFTSKNPLTLMFAIGGAGAQQWIAGDLINNLKTLIREQEINLHLVAGQGQMLINISNRILERLNFMTR